MADDLKTHVSSAANTAEDNPRTIVLHRQLTDEEQAYRSLDDTVMRPMPESEVIWDAEPIRRPASGGEPHWPRIKTGVLVAVVAVVSFVAGGLTARMSSQVPVLFERPEKPIEATASYEQTAPSEQAAPVEQPEEQVESYEPVEQVESYEPVEQESEPAPDESYDTGYGTDYDTGHDTGEDHGLQWNFAPESNGSLGYDNDNNEVTLNYDGYSVTFTLDDLLGTDDSSSSETDSTWEQAPGYDSGTSYDTEGQRDRDSWGWPDRGNSGFGWGGYSG